MSSATSQATHRSAAPVQRPRPTAQHSMEAPRVLSLGNEEAAVLQLDLSDLAIPKMGGLHVDGFKPSFFQRLFGKK
jgi:hypothetical protein